MRGSAESTTGPVAVEVLGPVRLVVDGRPVLLTAQQRTVLAMLATAEGRRCTVDALAQQLWRDAPPASGLNALRVLVRSIRRMAPAPFLLTGDRSYTLSDDVVIDLRDAEQALRACVAAAVEEDDVVAVTWFVEARRRVRGPVLADADADLAEVRSGFEELLLDGLESVTDARIRLGTAGTAVEELIAAAAANPLRETLQERLVRALSATGRRAEAIEAYSRTRAAIVDQLGIEPGPQLRRAFESVLRADDGGPPSARADVRTGLRSVPVPLVGRAAELDLLQRLLEHHRLVTLVGLGGVGKTRLAQAFVESRPRTAAFAALVSARTDDDVAVTLASELGVPAAGDMDAALAAALRRVPRGFVLVIDNLEHLPAVGPFVDRLLAAVPDLTVLATSRVPLGIPIERRVLIEPLGTTSSDGAMSAASTLLLERVRALGEVDEPTAAEQRALERIAEQCSGLPLALELAAARSTSMSLAAIADALATSRDLLRAAPRSESAPLERTVLDMVRALPAEVASTLAAASAFAGGCTIEKLAIAVDRSELDTADHVGMLRERGLLRRAVGLASERRFGVLEVIRDAVLSGSTPEDAARAADGQLRAMLHWLRTRATTRDFPRTGREFEEFLDERANLRVAMRRATADEDVADLFVLAATGWFRADGAFEHIGPLQALLAGDRVFSPERRFDLIVALIHLRGANGDPGEMALLAEAEALGVDDPARRAEVLMERAMYSLIEGDAERSDHYATEMESLPEDRLDVSLQAQIGERRSSLLALSGRVDEGVALARKQIARCRAANRDLPTLIIATNLSDLQLQVGRYEDAAATCAEVIATTHPAEHHYRSFALTNRSTALQLAGRPGDAIEVIRAALELQNGVPDLSLSLMSTTVAACAFVGVASADWAVAAGAADEARRTTGILLQAAERRLQEVRLPSLRDDARYDEGVELVRARGPIEAVAEMRSRLLALR